MDPAAGDRVLSAQPDGGGPDTLGKAPTQGKGREGTDTLWSGSLARPEQGAPPAGGTAHEQVPAEASPGPTLRWPRWPVSTGRGTQGRPTPHRQMLGSGMREHSEKGEVRNHSRFPRLKGRLSQRCRWHPAKCPPPGGEGQKSSGLRISFTGPSLGGVSGLFPAAVLSDLGKNTPKTLFSCY